MVCMPHRELFTEEQLKGKALIRQGIRYRDNLFEGVFIGEDPIEIVDGKATFSSDTLFNPELHIGMQCSSCTKYFYAVEPANLSFKEKKVQDEEKQKESIGPIARTSEVLDVTKETLFDKIISKEHPVNIFFEDEEVLAFENNRDAQAPIHFVVIPKKRIVMLEEAKDEDGALLGKLLLTAAKVARDLGVTDGYRVVLNDGKNGCQSILHLHLHILAGRQLGWPPG